MGCPESLHVQRVFGEVCELRRECKRAAHYHKAPLRYSCKDESDSAHACSRCYHVSDSTAGTGVAANDSRLAEGREYMHCTISMS